MKLKAYSLEMSSLRARYFWILRQIIVRSLSLFPALSSIKPLSSCNIRERLRRRRPSSASSGQEEHQGLTGPPILEKQSKNYILELTWFRRRSTTTSTTTTCVARWRNWQHRFLDSFCRKWSIGRQNRSTRRNLRVDFSYKIYKIDICDERKIK